ncbi:DUF5682 family protein [Viridibacterium curvum]|uniref:DUF5682 family protein n=1 Tax=Viridibacterium curvum TaxID=1101404 RepID=A0ABP9QRF9_9RHOO
MADTPFHLFGIRHHGPGCARSLLRALEALQPDCLLVEGPPDGEEMLPLLGDPGLVPPVALLIYNPEDSREAAFYPFAAFSPEWNALHFAQAKGIPARFIDLPMTHQFALSRPPEEAEAAPDDAQAQALESGAETVAAEEAGTEVDEGYAGDPLDWLGRAAGYGDGESWWNHMVEERGDSLELFAAIREAMTTVRNEASARPQSEKAQHREALREAHMRKCLRQAQKEGFQRIAVVCGAWHVPALAEMPAAKADNELLKALPKTKVAATWVPWSYRNLSFASGYGAGVMSPGWYEHLWNAPAEQRATSWLARAAALFRDEGLDCSSAHIIEAVRLADALAALRERPQPGLDELSEALRTTVCMGDDAPMQLIAQRLIVGERLGSTPENAPAVPLQRDLAQQQKSLRLKPEATQKTLDLDLRQPNDLARSHLLHRLALLGIQWGSVTQAGRSAKGSFHEVWHLSWEPELAIAVINASRWGNTVEEAASARAIDKARSAEALPELSELVNQVLLADLQSAIAPVTQALEDLAAVSSDVLQLLAAIPPLANVARYGNVRQTDAGMVAHLLASLVPRAAIGLPGACASLDDEAAASMRDAIVATQQALRLMGDADLQQDWQLALKRLATLGSCHGLVCGLAARLLFDDQQEDIEATAQRMSQALSAGNDPGPAAAWLEGFLNRSGMVLLHDDQLWALVDDWLSGLSGDHFLRELPLLRRAFAAFNVPERRQLGERAGRPTGVVAAKPVAADWDMPRAERALPLLRQLLGVAE